MKFLSDKKELHLKIRCVTILELNANQRRK